MPVHAGNVWNIAILESTHTTHLGANANVRIKGTDQNAQQAIQIKDGIQKLVVVNARKTSELT